LRDRLAKFLQQLRAKQLTVVVVGLGYVGLPTAAWIAHRGFKVIGVDMNEQVVESVCRGQSHLKEPGLSSLVGSVVGERNLTATTDLRSAVSKSQVIVVCVQTPISDHKPDLRHLENAINEVAEAIDETQGTRLVILESSVPPGTTDNVIGSIFTKQGFVLSRDLWLAYCPERIAPGKTLEELKANARIVGGLDAESAAVASEFVRVAYGVDSVQTNSRTAELAKLVENISRDVGIAFVNELALVCEHLQVDMLELTHLVNSHPRVKILTPGPGVGGPCLPKDTYLLMDSLGAWSLAYSNFMRMAREINERMPDHLIRITAAALKEAGVGEGATISVLGTTYKGDTDDVRSSPVRHVIEWLLTKGFRVRAFDPMTSESFGALCTSSIEECVQGANCIMILADHTVFKKIDLSRLAKLAASDAILVDGRQLYDKAQIARAGFHLVGLGRVSMSPLDASRSGAFDTEVTNKL